MSKLMPDGTRATVVICNDCGNSFPCKVVIRTAGELAMPPYLCLFGMNRSKGRKATYTEIPIEEYNSPQCANQEIGPCRGFKLKDPNVPDGDLHNGH